MIERLERNPSRLPLSAKARTSVSIAFKLYINRQFFAPKRRSTATGTDCAPVKTSFFVDFQQNLIKIYSIMPISSKSRPRLRQSSTTLTNNLRKTFLPKSFSTSYLASVPIFFSLMPPLPIMIPFCELLST